MLDQLKMLVKHPTTGKDLLQWILGHVRNLTPHPHTGRTKQGGDPKNPYHNRIPEVINHWKKLNLGKREGEHLPTLHLPWMPWGQGIGHWTNSDNLHTLRLKRTHTCKNIPSIGCSFNVARVFASRYDSSSGNPASSVLHFVTATRTLKHWSTIAK